MPLPERFKPLPMFGHNSCFGCGSDNAAGLHMKFYSDGRSVASSLTVPDRLCGWPQVAHGGIVATILDEIMGWTAIYLMKKVVLTKRLSVDFIKPTPLNEPLFVQGWVTEQPDARHVVIHSEIQTPDQAISAKGEGLFTLFPLDEGVKLGLFAPELIEALQTMFLAEQS